MSGMNTNTGTKISDWAHIQQSIADILTTPLGSRIMREEYGSLLFELIDAPQNEGLQLQIYNACIMAIQANEPRVLIESIANAQLFTAPEKRSLTLNVLRIDTGMAQQQQIEVPL